MMAKPTYEDALAFLEAQDIKLYNYQKEILKLFWDNKYTDCSPLFDELIIPFKVSHKLPPFEDQQIYISTADMHDNPFAKMVTEYLKTIKEK